MQNKMKKIELIVGLFMLAGFIAFLVLALKVSGLSGYMTQSSYEVTADFDNIGDLKVRAPVTIAGVRIGEVSAINLDRESFRARVQLRIHQHHNKIPNDSSARILTEGILGSNYVSLSPGYGEDKKPGFLTQGSRIEETHPALILENLIGQLVFSLGNKENKKE